MIKLLSNGCKISVYWNNYQTVPAKVIKEGANIYKLRSASFQSLKRLFVLAYVIAANPENNEADIKNNRNHFLPRAELKDYNILIDGRNFHDQPISELTKH